MNKEETRFKRAFDVFVEEFSFQLSLKAMELKINPQTCFLLREKGYTAGQHDFQDIFATAIEAKEFILGTRLIVEVLAATYAIPIRFYPQSSTATIQLFQLEDILEGIHEETLVNKLHLQFSPRLESEINELFPDQLTESPLDIINLLIGRHEYQIAAEILIETIMYLFNVRNYTPAPKLRPLPEEIPLEDQFFDSVDIASMPNLVIDTIKSLHISTNRKVKALYLIERFKRLKSVRPLAELIKFLASYYAITKA